LAIPTPGASNVLLRFETLAPTSNAAVRAGWPTRPGWQYQPQFLEGVPEGVWQPYGPVLTATVSWTQTDLPLPTNAAPRFYRVRQR
jgi:hypothetical protein